MTLGVRRILGGSLAGLLVIVLGSLGLWYSVSLPVQGDLSRSLRSMTASIDKDFRQREQVIESLSEFHAGSCEEAMLKRLRLALLDSENIVDLVVFAPEQNKMICSALQGKYLRPIDVQGVGFVPVTRPERTLWLNTTLPLMDRDRPIHLTRQSWVGVAIDPMKTLRDVDGHDWQVFAVDDAGAFARHGYGMEGLHQAHLDAAWNPFRTLHYARACASEAGRVCAVVRLTLENFVRQNAILLSAGSIANILLAAWAFSAVSWQIARRYSVEGRIKRALRSGGRGFYCVYQPIIDLETGAAIGCEVLARYKDEIGGLAPDRFISVIEALGKTWQFTEIVLQNSLEDLRPYLRDNRGYRVSINFFPSDLLDRNLKRLSENPAIVWARENRCHLSFELLEVGGDAPGQMDDTLAFLRECGFSVAIDDFGTGHSNISQVKSIRADYLKVDKSFVQDDGLHGEDVHEGLLQAIIRIADLVDVAVVCEGVETEEQFWKLRELGVPYGQGYYFARPLPIHDFISLGFNSAHRFTPEADQQRLMLAAV